MPKLPAPKEEDVSKGILEAIDMDSYRVEKKAARRIQLPDADAEIEPVPTSGGGRKPEPELDRLSNILKAFNDQFGNISWTDRDLARRRPAQTGKALAAWRLEIAGDLGGDPSHALKARLRNRPYCLRMTADRRTACARRGC